MELAWKSFAAFLAERTAAGGARPALTLFEDGWRVLSYGELARSAEARAQALLRSGHRPGDRVAVLAPLKLELTPELLGIILAGGIAVPLDAKLSEDEHLSILKHVEPRSLLVSEEFQTSGRRLAERLGILKLLPLEREPAAAFLPPLPLPERNLEDTVANYYTSGTLGRPKGVMVSARSILAEITALTSFRENDENDVIYSILPLNHLYGFTAGVLFSLACGSEYVFAHSLRPEEISRCLKERRVTMLIVVPLLLNLMRRGILAKFAQLPPGRRRIAELSLKVAPYLPISVRRAFFQPIHEKMGGRLRAAISGAAPLDAATFKFFQAIGTPIYEGYGLTETGPVISVNHPGRARMGSAGQALPGIEIKIASAAAGEEGEILTRGPHLMQGYFRDEALTNEAIDQDGWFHTGDLGRIENGYLRILGRSKGLIVLGSGKKVHAEEVEQALSVSQHFQDVCVIGASHAQGEQVTAVVHLSEEGFGQAAAEAEVAKRCAKLAEWKRPQRVILRTEPFAKTSSGKVKRHVVLREVNGK